MHMKLIETQQARLSGYLGGNLSQRISLAGVTTQTLLQLLQEDMEMHPTLLRQWRGREAGIQHKAFTAPHATMQVDPASTAAQPARAGLQKCRKPRSEEHTSELQSQSNL